MKEQKERVGARDSYCDTEQDAHTYMTPSARDQFFSDLHEPFRQELISSLRFICLVFLIINHVRGPARMVFLTDE